MKISTSVARILILLPIFVLSMGPASAGQDIRIISSINAVLSRDAVRPGETFKAAVILEIEKGYHINDSTPLDEFLHPTSLKLEEAAGFEVLETAYPAGRPMKVDYSDVDVAVYEGRVVIGVLLKAADGLAPGTVKLAGTLSYQACDETTCLPPAEIGFEIAVPVVPASQATVETHTEIFEKIVFRASGK